MKLKGDFNSATTYDVGDVVCYSDGNVYKLLKPAKAGTTPIDTLFWNRLSKELSECVLLVMDGVGLAVVKAETDVAALLGTVPEGKTVEEQISEVDGKIPTNISSEAITLTGTGDNEYLITVDDSGETPDLDVTLSVHETPDEPAAEEET